MMNFYPGTIIQRSDKSAGEFLFGIFTVTKGLTLAQVREITGLDTPAIQNWVNRGWVAHPIEKRYTINHLARILIINMLRDAMRLDAIATVLSFINGDVEDQSDNIITEAQLYLYICKAIEEYHGDERELKRIIDEVSKDYTEPMKGAEIRLKTALEIFLAYYDASQARKYADEVYNKTF